MRFRSRLFLTATALAAAFLVLGPDAAEAGRRKPRGRGKQHRFLSAKAPTKGRTPQTSDDGAPAGAARDVSGDAFEGIDRQQSLSGGSVALVLSPTRALVANPYRGLSVVDVSDPDQPTILGTVAVGADRLFVDGDVVTVVLNDQGLRTVVTTVDLSDETQPTVLGSVEVEGGLTDAVVDGDGLIVVTGGWTYGPWMYSDVAGAPGDAFKGANGRGGADGGADGGAPAPDFWYPYGGASQVRVARISRDAGDAPVAGDVFETEGSLLAHDVADGHVVLAVDDTQWNWDGTAGGSTGGLHLLDVDASGTPSLVGSADVTQVSGVSLLDVADGVARLLGWGGSASRVVSFQLGAGDPSFLGSLDVDAWPSASAFVGDRLVYVESGGYVWTGDGNGGDEPKPGDPTGGPSNGIFRHGQGGYGGYEQQPARLTAIDLSNASAPSELGSVELTGDWVGSLTAAGDDAVVTMGDYENGALIVDRVDLGAAPQVEDSENVTGSWWATERIGDLLLLSGGTATESGGWTSQIRPISVAGTTDLVVGGAVDAPTWGGVSAWSDPILATASFEGLSLYDLTDFAAPAARGSVRLAVNVADLQILDDSTAIALVADYVGGDIELRSVSLPTADVLQPLDTLTVGTGDARLFRDGSMLYVLATDWSDGSCDLTVVDASDPSDLRARGSLELASYPGQVFHVNGALVLLREAWSLVYEDENTGRMKSHKDPFGRAATGWTRDELSAVLDVVDLSDPDAPEAAVRKRIRWDWGGEAILRGTTLYVPSYVAVGTSPDGWDRYAYGVRGVELANPLQPRVRGLVWVPGSLVGAVDDAGKVLTVSYDYDRDTFDFDASLNLCDLDSDSWRSRVEATQSLGGSITSVVAGDEHAYVTTESWDYEDYSVEYALDVLALSDLSVVSSQARERSAWGGTIAGGHLFLRTWGWSGALDVYDLSDAANPAAAATAEVDGVGTNVGVAGGRAYVPAGYHGIFGFDL